MPPAAPDPANVDVESDKALFHTLDLVRVGVKIVSRLNLQP